MVTISIYKKDNYLNKNIDYLLGNEIIEYDIRSAGLSIIKQYKLLDDDVIKKLEDLSKNERNISIGKMRRKDKNLSKRISEGFELIRKDFFQCNSLEDSDILSIKKDAIFSLKRCQMLDFDNVVFVEKGFYTSYFYLNKKEFYYNSHSGVLDIKGINDTSLQLHQEYFIKVLKRMFQLIEMGEQKKAIKYIKEFTTLYKARELHLEYYRELKSDSTFTLNDSFSQNKTVTVKDLGNDFIHHIDINYNFINYIRPIMNILV